MKILIAEDNFACLSVLASVLKKGGHEVVETRNGNEAWGELQQPDPPKILILDWMMPEMDGPEVVRRCRELNTDRPPYIFMLTVNSDKDHIIAGLTAGANDYLIKPFDPDELLVRVAAAERTVEMQLRQHRQRVNAQLFRVEVDQRMAEMQDALSTKVDELRRAQTDLQVMAARLQAVRDGHAEISHSLNDSVGQSLLILQSDLLRIDRQLQTIQTPEQQLLSHQIIAMARVVEGMSEQTQKLCASLLTNV